MAKLYDKFISGFRHIKVRFFLGLAAVGLSLLVSCIISVLEFVSMRSYVSDLIANNIANINSSQSLASLTDSYNLALLTVIGEDDANLHIPSFNNEAFLDKCDSLKSSLSEVKIIPKVDSVLYAYSAYMLTSQELSEVLLDDFTDTRDWYFGRLQPKYHRLHNDIEALSGAIYDDLEKNSKTFERGFYKSIIPSMISSGVSLLLILLLLFFLISNYAVPIGKMYRGLADINSGVKKKYSYVLEDGDDELEHLNREIITLVDEYTLIKKRDREIRHHLDVVEELAKEEADSSKSK